MASFNLVLVSANSFFKDSISELLAVMVFSLADMLVE
jgi:hypothetical protein